MSLVTQDSRIVIKSSTVTNAVPTVAPSSDHTDGSWSVDDIYKGELYINLVDSKIWFRDNSGIQRLALYSDVTATNELSEILTNGNTTGGNNIIITNGDSIQSADGNSLIGLANGGEATISTTSFISLETPIIYAKGDISIQDGNIIKSTDSNVKVDLGSGVYQEITWTDGADNTSIKSDNNGIVLSGSLDVFVKTAYLRLGNPSSSTTEVLFYNGTNNNYVGLKAGSTATTYSLTLPTAQGSANTYLKNDGSGNLSWSTVAGGSGTVISITAGTGLTGGTITTSGTIAVDTSVILTTASAASTYVPYSSATSDLNLNAKNIKNFFISKTSDATAKMAFDVSALSTATTRTLTVRDLSGTIALTSDLSSYQPTLSGTGIVKSTSGTISYLTDNTTNWDTAYTNRITSLTTTGSSGAATLSSNTLNIPTYTLSGLGGGNWATLNYPTWSSGTPFVKMTAAGTFALDTNTYLTTSSAASTYASLASPTFTGHITTEGVTATGATGTGKFVFDTAPTLQTSLNLAFSTASRALVTDASKNVIASSTTSTEIGYVSGVTSAIQTQINGTQSYLFQSVALSPADATNYHASLYPIVNGTVDTARRTKFAVAGTLVNASFSLVQNTNGSNETVYIYLRNISTATDTLIGTFTSDFGASTSKGWTFTGLSISVNATDDYCVKFACPTWVTNPTWAGHAITLNIKG